MRKEAAVLNGEERIHNRLRQLIIRNVFAQIDAYFRDEVSFIVIDLAGLFTNEIRHIKGRGIFDHTLGNQKAEGSDNDIENDQNRKNHRPYAKPSPLAAQLQTPLFLLLCDLWIFVTDVIDPGNGPILFTDIIGMFRICFGDRMYLSIRHFFSFLIRFVRILLIVHWYSFLHTTGTL